MSATKDFLMEVEEAKEYLEREFPQIRFEIHITTHTTHKQHTNNTNTQQHTHNNGIHVYLGNLEYDINPIPRDDYPKSRRMKGWRLIHHTKVKSVEVGELVPSYEQAAKLLVQDLSLRGLDPHKYRGYRRRRMSR